MIEYTELGRVLETYGGAGGAHATRVGHSVGVGSIPGGGAGESTRPESRPTVAIRQCGAIALRRPAQGGGVAGAPRGSIARAPRHGGAGHVAQVRQPQQEGGRTRQAERTLLRLLGYDPASRAPGQPGYGAGSGRPEVMLAYVKHQWSLGNRRDAFARLQSLVGELGCVVLPPKTHPSTEFPAMIFFLPVSFDSFALFFPSSSSSFPVGVSPASPLRVMLT